MIGRGPTRRPRAGRQAASSCRAAARRSVLGLMLLAAGAAACGKKGPPLPPIVRIPAAVETMEIRRVGADVFVTFTLPVRNVDGSTPPDLARVELYAVTAAAAPPRERVLEQASRLAVVPVAPLAAEAPDDPQAGATLTLHDTIADTTADTTPETDPDGAPLRRFYSVVTSSARGVSTGPGPPGELPLVAPPPSPADAVATWDEGRIEVRWAPVPAADGEAPPRYAVYRVPAADAPPDPDTPPDPPVALGDALLDAPPFIEAAPADEIERCYVVRAVRAASPPRIEGDASAPACVVPVDTTPPAAPRGLSAVALDGAISLVWAPNEEPDLAGYLVLRGEPGDATLTPLTGEPVPVTQYVDRTVVAGRRYVYAVVALDRRDPPNVSPESTHVEETAR